MLHILNHLLDLECLLADLLYNCKNIYIDNFDNIKSSSPSTTPPSSPKSNNTDISNNINSIFYSNPNSKSNSKSNSNSNSNNKEIFNYQSNKYKYKGTIQTFIKKINNFQIYLVNDIIDDYDNEYDNEYDTLHDISINSLQDNTSTKLDLSYNYITDNLPLHNIIFSIKKKTSNINIDVPQSTIIYFRYIFLIISYIHGTIILVRIYNTIIFCNNIISFLYIRIRNKSITY